MDGSRRHGMRFACRRGRLPCYTVSSVCEGRSNRNPRRLCGTDCFHSALSFLLTFFWVRSQLFHALPQYIQLVVPAIALACGFLAEKLISNRRGGSEIVLGTSFGCNDPHKFLLIRSSGDEASGSISAAYILSWLPVRLFDRLTRISRKQLRDSASGGTWRELFRVIRRLLILLLFLGFLVNMKFSDAVIRVILVIGVIFIASGYQLLAFTKLSALATMNFVLLGITLLVRCFLALVFIGPDMAKHAFFSTLRRNQVRQESGMWYN